VVHACKNAFTHDMPMVVRPTSYLGLSSLIKSAADKPSASLIVLRMPFRKAFTFLLEGLMSSFPFGYLRRSR